MSNSDGKVRIIIDTNANEAAKALDNTSNAFNKAGKAAQNASTVFDAFQNEVDQNVKRLRDMALVGGQNSTKFKQLAKSTKDTQKMLAEANSAVQKATQDFSSFEIAGINVSNALKTISAVAIARTLSDMGKSAVQTAGEFEQLQTSFKVMAGGAEAGEQLTNSLIDLAAKTPMTTQGLARATRTLLSFGESSENVIEDLKLLGNISGGEEQRFQSLALAFAQVGSTGRLMGQDLLQMVNQGFNPLQIISEKTEKSMATLKKEMEEGKISFDMVKQAMIDATSEGGRFYGLMEEQSQTLNGRLSTLDDTWQLVAKDIGDLLLPTTKSAVNGMIALGEASQKALTAFNQNTQLKSTTVAIAGATTAIVGTRTVLLTIPPALAAIRNGITAINLTGLLNPIGLVSAAIGVTVGMIIKAKSNLDDLKNSTDNYTKSLKAETDLIVSQLNEYKNLIGVKNRTNEQNEKLIALTSDLADKYPQYIGQLQKELRLKGEISKATAEQIANEMTLAKVKDLQDKQRKIEKTLNARGNYMQYDRVNEFGIETVFMREDELTKAFNKNQRAIANQFKDRQKIIEQLTQKYEPKTNLGGFSSSAVTGGSGAVDKQIKDDYEKLQAAVQAARREIELAALAHGTSSTQVQNAFVKYNQLNTQLSSVNALFANEKQKVDETKGAYEQLQQRIQLLRTDLLNLGANGGIGTEQFEQLKNEYIAAMNEIQNIDKSLTQEMGKNWDSVSKSISYALGSNLMSALQGGQSALQAFSSVAQSLLQQVLNKMLEMAVITPILNALTGGTGGTLFGGISKLFSKHANGDIFKNGNVIPFAKGGVVSKPTVFPMANGGTGLMGEAGAEAVMPLRRMSNGRLGVEASNGNDGKAVQVNIYNQSNSQVETRKRDDGSMDIIIKRVNEALMNERTSSGFRAAYQREDRKGLQAV